MVQASQQPKCECRELTVAEMGMLLSLAMGVVV